MKKPKLILAMVALMVFIGAGLAFKAQRAIVGDLYCTTVYGGPATVAQYFETPSGSVLYCSTKATLSATLPKTVLINGI